LSITLRLRDVPPALEARFRETIEDALEGDWSVTLSRSHLDGQWHLQLDGSSDRFRVVLPALQDVRMTGLRHLLRRLMEADDPVPLNPASVRPGVEGQLR
jgi:hypothetical protein